MNVSRDGQGQQRAERDAQRKQVVATNPQRHQVYVQANIRADLMSLSPEVVKVADIVLDAIIAGKIRNVEVRY
jgi:hypothetical protein